MQTSIIGNKNQEKFS